MNINNRNEEIIKNFMNGCWLNLEERNAVMEWAKNCEAYGDACPLDCPLCEYKAKQCKNEEFPVVSCAAFLQNLSQKIVRYTVTKTTFHYSMN